MWALDQRSWVRGAPNGAHTRCVDFTWGVFPPDTLDRDSQRNPNIFAHEAVP